MNFYGNEVSYSLLNESIKYFAGALSKKGIVKGDRVAVYVQNSPHFIISYFGIMRANAVVVPVNPMLTGEELAFLIKDSGAKVLITTSELLPRVTEIKDKVKLETVIAGSLVDYLPNEPLISPPGFMSDLGKFDKTGGVEVWEDLIGKKYAPPPVEVDKDSLCMLPYTSGSTGLPKGCMHTHKTVMANLLSSYYWMCNTPSSVHLSVLPFFHVTGLIHSVLAPLYAGAPLVLLTRWDRNAALEAIEKLRCTHWVNITTMVVDLLNATDIKQRDLSSLVVIGGGGAPLPVAVGERLKEITGLDYIEGYGLTETISQTHFYTVSGSARATGWPSCYPTAPTL